MFSPSATDSLPLSTTALHIAHCECEILKERKQQINNIFFTDLNFNNMEKSLRIQSHHLWLHTAIEEM